MEWTDLILFIVCWRCYVHVYYTMAYLDVAVSETHMYMHKQKSRLRLVYYLFVQIVIQIENCYMPAKYTWWDCRIKIDVIFEEVVTDEWVGCCLIS